MSDSTMMKTSRLLNAEPQLFVSEIDATCDFLAAKLGFEIAFKYGDPPFYAQVSRDGAQLNLRHVDGPVFHPTLRTRERDVLSATINVSDTAGLFAEFQTRGVTFHQEIKREAWGVETFIVSDPDGNLLLFAGPAT